MLDSLRYYTDLLVGFLGAGAVAVGVAGFLDLLPSFLCTLLGFFFLLGWLGLKGGSTSSPGTPSRCFLDLFPARAASCWCTIIT